MIEFPSNFLQNHLMTTLSQIERSQLMASATAMSLQDKEVLYRQGEESDGIYWLSSGFIRFDIINKYGDALMVSIISSGHFFGELELAPNSTRLASCSTIQNAELLFFPKATLLKSMQANASFLLAMLDFQAESLRSMTKILTNASLIKPEERLARIFLSFYKLLPANQDQSALIDYRITHDDMANMLATSRQNISKILNGWKKEGLIQLKYGSVELLDCPGLCSIAGWKFASWKNASNSNSEFHRISID